MAKRIVKHTFADGRSEYVIQTNRLFGFIPIPWRIVVFNGFHSGVFQTLKEAKEVLDSYRLVRTEVIETYK